MVGTCYYGYRCTNPWCTYSGHPAGRYFDRVWEATASGLAPSLQQLPAKNDEWKTGSYVEVLKGFQAFLSRNQGKEVSWPSNLCAVMNPLRTQVANDSSKGHGLCQTEALSPLLSHCRQVAGAVCKEIHHEHLGDTTEPLETIIDKLLLLDLKHLKSKCIYQVALSADLVRAGTQISAVHCSVQQQPDKVMASAGNLLLLTLCSLKRCLKYYARYLRRYPNRTTILQQQAARQAVQTALSELQNACGTSGGSQVQVEGEWWQKKLKKWLLQKPAQSEQSSKGQSSRAQQTAGAQQSLVKTQQASKKTQQPLGTQQAAEVQQAARAHSTIGAKQTAKEHQTSMPQAPAKPSAGAANKTLNPKEFARDLQIRLNLHLVQEKLANLQRLSAK